MPPKRTSIGSTGAAADAAAGGTPSPASTSGAGSSSSSSSSSSNQRQTKSKASAPNGTSSDKDRDKPRLTEQERKINHIASEQKRRQAIRDGFDRLSYLVPGLEGQARSEGVVLQKTLEFMRQEIEERKRLIVQIEALGGSVPDKFKEAISMPIG